MNAAYSVRIVGMAAAAALLVACGDTAGPTGEQRQLSVLQLEGFSGAAEAPDGARGVHWDVEPRNEDVVAALSMPDTVSAGEPFEITVHTIGNGGCWSAAGQDVAVSAEPSGGAQGTVAVTPYDVHSGADVCTLILAFLPHTSSVTLDAPGEWVVRVTGRRARHGDSEWHTPVSAEKTIVVR